MMDVPDYAARLSVYPNKGLCGLPERSDKQRVLERKLRKLVELVDAAEGSVVVLTGAGISTSAGIPDFRGPKGVWTNEKRERERARTRKKRRKIAVAPPPPAAAAAAAVAGSGSPFSNAAPTATHTAISTLIAEGVVAFCITQNVDPLHQRSGLPRAKLAVLHGCLFEARCEKCRAVTLVDDELATISFQSTGKTCKRADCGGVMRDTLLDWVDLLPEDEFAAAEARCDDAELVIVLGSSLRIEPAGSLPMRAKRGYVIVNLQETPKDSSALLTVRAKVDVVMEHLLANVRRRGER